MKIFVIGLITLITACSTCCAQQSIPHVDELMKQYDLDRNGALTAAEVEGSRYARQYTRWDIDSDGSVSKEDVIQFRAKFGIAADGSQMSRPSSLPKSTSPRSLKIPSIESPASGGPRSPYRRGSWVRTQNMCSGPNPMRPSAILMSC